MLSEGNNHQDERGTITFNNDFDASQIKRIYTIENHSIDFVRGWQGHQVEQRWFCAISGIFEISVIQVDNFENPIKKVVVTKHKLTSTNLDILHIPPGFITAIQAIEENSKLLVMSDYLVGEINDEYRFPPDFFNQN